MAAAATALPAIAGVTRIQSGALWKYAQLVGDACDGAVTHPGAKAETHVYADV